MSQQKHELFRIDDKSLNKFHVCIKEYKLNTLDEIWELLDDAEYKIVAWNMHSLCLGYGDAKQRRFAADKFKLEDKYLLEMRIFNAEQEVYVRRQQDVFYVRVIRDGIEKTEDSEELETVDRKSKFFGEADKAPEADFVKLTEAGRKIELQIPCNTSAAEDKPREYILLTRSYIKYDTETQQAGYAYYRWLDIVPFKG